MSWNHKINTINVSDVIQESLVRKDGGNASNGMTSAAIW